MRVREPAELERVALAEATERRALLLAGRSALAPERLDERPVLGEEVVAGKRRRVGGTEGCGGRHPGSLVRPS